MAVQVSIEGQQARVDAMGARLLSQLRGNNGAAWLTVRTADGESVHRAVPAGARQGTFKLGEQLTVDATSSSDFVAVTRDDGRALVVAYAGEVVVKPAGDAGERFALAPNDALLVPSGGEAVRVVSTAALSDADATELGAMVDEAAAAVLADPRAGGEPTQPVEKVEPAKVEPAKVEPEPAKAAAPAVAAEKRAPAQPARAVTKKGKKPKKKAAPVKATAGSAASAASGAPKGQSRPPAKATGSAGKPPRTPPPPVHEGDGELESDPRARRAVIVVMGMVAVAVAVFLLLSGGDGDEPDEVASDRPTTTAEADEPTTAAPTTAAPTTAPATTTTVRATTTSGPVTTTTVRATTTTAAAAPAYAVAPKSCVQSGNTITYTAAITNQSSRAYDYVVSVVFNDRAGKQVAEAEARVDELGANRTTEFSATGRSTQDLANSGATCVVRKIDATPA